MKPYVVKLFWNEPDGSPNMMMISVMAEVIADAAHKAVAQLHTMHFIVDPIRIEVELDVGEATVARTSGSSSSIAGSSSQA